MSALFRRIYPVYGFFEELIRNVDTTRFFTEFTLSVVAARFFAALRMTNEGFRMTYKGLIIIDI